MQILNETSIELTIRNAQPQELMVICKLNNTFGVDITRVFVGKHKILSRNVEWT